MVPSTQTLQISTVNIKTDKTRSLTMDETETNAKEYETKLLCDLIVATQILKDYGSDPLNSIKNHEYILVEMSKHKIARRSTHFHSRQRA